MNIPTKYGLIWYSTSILGSWSSHWSCVVSGLHFDEGEVPFYSDSCGCSLHLGGVFSFSMSARTCERCLELKIISRYKLYEPEKSEQWYLLLDQRCNRFVISWCWWISSWKCACLSQPPEFVFYQETCLSIQILILLLELQERLAGRPHFQSAVWCSLAQSPGENLI